jgi:mRNA interferase MazF
VEALRGEIWWAELDQPRGSAPGFRRPVVVIQSDALNRSRIATTIVAAVTSNLRHRDVPANVFLPARTGGLPKDSVANVSQLLTVNKGDLETRIGKLSPRYMAAIDAGLKFVMDLA